MFSANVIADEPAHHTPCTGSVEFERLKGLAGSWQDTVRMKHKEQESVMYQDNNAVESTTSRLPGVVQL